MDRRAFLAAAGAFVAVPGRGFAQTDGWRTFEVTTLVEIQRPSGPTRAWLPLAYAGGADYQRVVSQRWRGNAATLRAIRNETLHTGILFADWPESEQQPQVELTLRIATRDRTVDWRSLTLQRVPRTTLQRYLEPTRLLPLDGIVRETALRVTKGETEDVAKARTIYEWIVENTVRDPDVRGCGVGDIRGMLESGNLRGKCADLNSLFVGLARAAGIPARDLFGVRVAPGRAFKSLGTSEDATSAQHCRAEFYSERYGWVPVDPADVRKVILQERPGLDLSSPEVQYARRQLFGSWEMNWIAFNDAHDLPLPYSTGPAVPFFMYPQAETGERRLDSLSPADFRYRITAREVESTPTGKEERGMQSR